MNEDFNLSRKIRSIASLDLESKGFIYIEDIKTFINLLKQEIEHRELSNKQGLISGYEIKVTINELAGERLISVK